MEILGVPANMEHPRSDRDADLFIMVRVFIIQCHVKLCLQHNHYIKVVIKISLHLH